MKLFGSSGIRRLYSRELLELTFRVGLALGADYRTVVVATDTRTTGSVMKHAACAGLLAAGAHVLDAGVLPTPALAFAAREADIGMMITASHNPPEYNGLKLFNPDGTSFADGQQQRLEAAVDILPNITDWQNPGNMEIKEGTLERYLDSISAMLPRLDGLRVIVDAGGGATSLATPGLLEKLGCEVIRLYCTPTGFFPRPSEPAEQNLGELKKMVVETGANLGVAHDGDGDRMVVIDEKGRYVSGDRLLCLLAEQDDIKSIVTTVDATMAIEETGKTVRRTAVGDTFVADELKNGGDFGGETSGCWMFPKVSLCPDGVYAAAFVAALAAQQPLSERLAVIPSYPLLRGSSPAGIDNLSMVEMSLAHLLPERIDRTDGLKMIFNDGWLLVRPSGTEPMIRLSAEARTEQRAHELYKEALQAVQTVANAGGQRV